MDLTIKIRKDLFIPVVTGDGHIDELEVGVSVAQGNGGDVHVAGFHDGLTVRAGVSHDQEAGFLELLGVLIGQGTRGPSGGAGAVGASVLGILEDGALTVGAGGHDLNKGVTMTSSGLSTVTMMRAANLIFSRVSTGLIRCTPSLVLLST